MGSSTRFVRKFVVLAASGVVLSAALAGCASDDKKPETTQTPSSSAPASSSSAPTEKNLSPTGGNSFTPGDKAPPPQTAAPGRHKY